MPASFARQWSARPGAAALIDAGDGRLVTAAELEALSRQLALDFLAKGLTAGDRLLWSPGAPLASAVVTVAALRAGLVLVPVNPRSTVAEIRHVMAETKPAACAPGSAPMGAAVAGIDHAVQLVDDGASVTRAPAASTTAGAVAGGLDASGASDRALILFTSGTTGRPKGAVHTHGSLYANAEALREAWRWSPDDRLVHALPMFHAHGLCVGLLGTLHAGASAVLLPHFGVPEVLGACSRFRATLFFGVPTMYHRMHASGRAGQLGSLRLAVSGSAALPAALHVAIAAASGMAILERYGTSETLMSLSNPYEGERRAGTVGFPLPGVEIRLLATASPAAASSAAGGETHDELLVRGPALFEGYFGRPAETAEAFEDGWYRTGDITSLDEDGYVRILGRTKELVISGGFNVYPAEIEDVLAEHPGVAQVAVTGTPSAEWGEVVTAWIVPAGDSDGLVAAVTTFAAQRLAPYKRPRIIHVVETLPRNALGKVVKHELDSGA